ncbi:ABC transporter substrate-binding protein [Cohnella abietis]|uniref:Sugar ABC transporter substrate-binding protein n=1 Tax=Cohnella abietis TaxID=2507935 RepID=A0A3T1CYA4_9BACL|nr:extracellular solute-binding protein [Cohnella abietis]BBI30814.1 sugar ABC transporter substrate-binding protein [Cohnella abietis]
MRPAVLRVRGRFLAVVVLAVGMLAASSGCTGKKPLTEPNEMTIACINQMTFDAFYRTAFQSVFPNTKFKIVPLEDPIYYPYNPNFGVPLKEMFETKKPDLVILWDTQYKFAADAGWLRDLENMASLNKFDLGTLHEGVLDRARNNEEGKLYGLSPTFDSSAVYYNKTLFQRYGVPLPDKDMTWDEILRLAGLFMDQPGGEEGVRGLSLKSLTKPFDLMSNIAQTEGVEKYDKTANRLTLDSKSWHAIISKIIAAYQHGTFITEPYKTKGKYIGLDEMRERDLFAHGKAALTVESDYYVGELKRLYVKFEWGVLPGPVQSRDPSRGGDIGVNSMFAIPAKSDHPQEAWKLIEEIMSVRMSEVFSERDSGLPAQVNGRMAKDPLYEVFYKLRPVPLQMEYSLGVNEKNELFQIIDDEIDAAISGRKSVDDAIAAIQKAGTRLLPAR